MVWSASSASWPTTSSGTSSRRGSTRSADARVLRRARTNGRRARDTPTKEKAMKVADVMTREVATVPASASLKEVAAVLAERHVSGLPVVNAAGRVLGVVSEADILAKERGAPEPSRV